MTDQERKTMYSKLTKEELIELCIFKDKTIDIINFEKERGLNITSPIPNQPLDKKGVCFGGNECTNPFRDCVNCPSRFTTSGGAWTTTGGTYTTNGSDIKLSPTYHYTMTCTKDGTYKSGE